MPQIGYVIGKVNSVLLAARKHAQGDTNGVLESDCFSEQANLGLELYPPKNMSVETPSQQEGKEACVSSLRRLSAWDMYRISARV